MTTPFLPRDRQFWLYHCSTIAMVVCFTLVSALVWRNLAGNVVASTLAWMLPYTLLVLIFRWMYERWDWERVTLPKLVPVIIAYGTVGGILTVAAVTLAVAPYYWHEMYTAYYKDVMQLSPEQFVLRSAVSGGLQSQLLICAWIFVYIGVRTKRRAVDAQLANERLHASLKESQLATLANQLNPHFLFNSLNNIRFMVHENAEQAETLILALSEILRYSLDRSKQAKVMLSEELTVVRRYITIVQTQFDNRLKFSMVVAKGIDNCLVPPMALQLLVENAIKHGIDISRTGGSLSVDIREEDGSLMLCVCNDVPPFADERADSIGIGLSNIRERLSLVYGTAAGMVHARSESEFAVQIALPVERAA